MLRDMLFFHSPTFFFHTGLAKGQDLAGSSQGFPLTERLYPR